MQSVPDHWCAWSRRFRQRADRPLPSLHADLDYQQLPASLARSLAIFQLGESGGGSVVDQARRSPLNAAGDSYADALELFCAEEARHANVLAVWVRLLGGDLIRSNWTARLFVFGRRLMGLRLKVTVLLAAEIIGLSYYRLLASRLPPCRLRDWLLDIVVDERDHLEFHCQFLNRALENDAERLLFRLFWRALLQVSGWLVLLDHRRTLMDMHITVDEIRSEWAALCNEVEHRVLRKDARQPGPARLFV